MGYKLERVRISMDRCLLRPKKQPPRGNGKAECIPLNIASTPTTKSESSITITPPANLSTRKSVSKGYHLRVRVLRLPPRLRKFLLRSIPLTLAPISHSRQKLLLINAPNLEYGQKILYFAWEVLMIRLTLPLKTMYS